MISKGANVNAVNEYRNTALMILMEHNLRFLPIGEDIERGFHTDTEAEKIGLERIIEAIKVLLKKVLILA